MKRVVGREPGHTKELLDKLQAGGCGFIAEPDTRFGEYKANWEEQRKPDAENPMTPVEWAKTQVATYVATYVADMIQSRGQPST